jgi:drug/metabolite transporter (DMT)-like permease
LLLLPLAHQHAKRYWPLFTRHWKVLSFLALVGISGFNPLLYIAVHTITAINAALIQTTMPAAIIVIVWIGYKEKITRLQSLGVGVCILGGSLVVLRGRFSTFFELSLLAIIWLGESLKAFHLIGMMLIFGGMVLFNR